MTIKILSLINDNKVEFVTNIGKGIGILKSAWKMKDDSFYVEFDINTALEPGKNVKIVSDKLSFIRHQGQINEIQGIVDSLDEDGLIYLRLSADCLIMIDIHSQGTIIKQGDYLHLDVTAEDLIIT